MSSRLILFLLSSFLLGTACSSSSTNANSASNANANVAVATNANLPPGFSTSPVQPSANTTPGIPAVNGVTSLGNTTAPGINPKATMRPIKPGEKIPGIDPEAARRQMSQNVNASPPTMTSNANPKPTKKP